MLRAARLAIGKHAVEHLDELRRGAAAAARRKQVQLPVGLHLHSVKLRGDVVTAAVGPGQARVGLDEDREISGHGLRQLLGHREDLFGSQRAVDAHGVGPQAPGRGRKALHRAARKGAAIGLKAHAGHDGQGAVLLGGQQSRFHFIQVGERLKIEDVRPGGHTGPDDTAILRHGVLKGQRPAGFQQLAQRAHIQRDQRAIRSHGLLAVGNARRDDLFQRVLAVGQLVGRSAKGIGVDDAAASGRVFCMDAPDEFRVFNVQIFRPGPQLHPGCLQHGAHAAIQQDGIGLMEQFTRLHRSSLSFDIRTGYGAHNARSPLNVP